MDRAERGDVFSKEDVSSLCELLFFVERDLEDEASCQISWTIKDRIMETIISLVLQDSSPGSFETIARAIDQCAKVPRPYLESVTETF